MDKAQIAQQFYDEVCRRAERNMQKTGRLEGAHYAAMQTVLQEWKDAPTHVCRLIPMDAYPTDGSFVQCGDDCKCD